MCIATRSAVHPLPIPAWLVSNDAPDADTFQAIYRALDACSAPLIGPATMRLLVIPIHDDAGHVAGGLWGNTRFRWLHIEMLVVPEPLRRRGLGSALVAAAEHEAQSRGCLGVYLDAFGFQAAGFYRALGFTAFGVLDDYPPGQTRHYLHKRFAAPA